MRSQALINALYKADYKKVDRLLKGANDYLSGNESHLLTTAVGVRCSDAVPIEHVILNIQTLLNHKPLRDGIKKDSVPNILASAVKSGHALVIYCLLKESFIVNAFPGNDLRPVADALVTAKVKIVSLLLKSTLGKYIIPDDDSNEDISQVAQPTVLHNSCQFFPVDSPDYFEGSIAEAMSEADMLSVDFKTFKGKARKVGSASDSFSKEERYTDRWDSSLVNSLRLCGSRLRDRFFSVGCQNDLRETIVPQAQMFSDDFESLASRSAQLKSQAHGFLHRIQKSPPELKSLTARIAEIENASNSFNFSKNGKKRDADSWYSSAVNYLGLGNCGR